ncbi:DUF4389 domain-containing protein [Maridesulfovibrio ferrireducens]|uniref:DUF4389 domain-containing protein n=1 Tax=Maridesulfovibrio ferrireducens TaxID=246191 RepID=UPI001A1BB97A|nr:DUF4389 domain-containing protein [Maridesulfovibrio ferrireducens]MBI9112108.1 DUF4389 domain-containing protein [Maridesulfovibrio ferrireducens]
MDNFKDLKNNRLDILKRLLRTIVCMIAFELVRLLLQAVVMFQYAYLLILGKSSAPLRRFGNRLSTYTYQLLRYATLNDNMKPFPFSDLPETTRCESPVSRIDFS